MVLRFSVLLHRILCISLVVCLANVQKNSGYSAKEGLADLHTILSIAWIYAGMGVTG